MTRAADTGLELLPERDLVLRDPVVHDSPVQVVEEGVDVGRAVGLEVEEVRVLVDVEGDERGRVPDRERVLRVTDVVEEPSLVPVVRRPGPAAAGHSRRLQVGTPRLRRAEVALDQIGDRALRVAAVAAEVLEVDLVVLDPADREGEVDLERAHVGVDLVRVADIGRGKPAEDLVPLAHVALVELVVGLDRRARDPVELQQRRLQLAGPDLLVTRHADLQLLRRHSAGTARSISFPPPAEADQGVAMPFTLPDLPYDHAALELTIDARTMEIHHGKHHQAYVDNANKALEGTELADAPVEEVLAKLDSLPEDKRAPVRNNAGGHANHSLFWELMSPEGGGGPAGGPAG